MDENVQPQSEQTDEVVASASLIVHVRKFLSNLRFL